jgi:diguanylate cyclase (GGDEF)-like protein
VTEHRIFMSRLFALSADARVANDAIAMAELAPISLWLEDYSGVLAQFAAWRHDGVVDLRSFLTDSPHHVRQCAALIRIVEVNRRTLELFEARDLPHLVSNLDRIFMGDMLVAFIEELVQLWEGKRTFRGNTVNYSLSGRRMDIQLNGVILPGYENSWERVLVSTDDVTERENARRALAESSAYAHGLFEHSPVSLWVEDFSAVKALLDDLKARGIEDLRSFTDVHPEFVERCMSEIRVLQVNQQTLRSFAASDLTELMLRKHEIFRDRMHQPFREQLIDLWSGKLMQRREVVNYALTGEELHFLMQFSVLPGHEADWGLVQIGLTDITARKKAEAYLEFLGKHDVLTKLHNRSFYVDELQRLQRGGYSPVTIIIIDLNGLKPINDSLGHAAGDQVLRRAGEILAAAVESPATTARIGGDEFAILMPGADERAGQTMIDSIHRLAQLNNQYYGHAPISFAMGAATGRSGEALEEIARRADQLMYIEKRRHHASRD